ncbi:serine hydrolase [Streptococcus gallolyticus]|nr:serine hydrolase [Streptococcus gallolyticus]MBY5040500.1 serine hydrolase [Streptococcus gallolyticus]
MKKILLAMGTVALSFLVGMTTASAQEDLLTMTQKAGYPATEAMTPKASIVLNAENGQVLWAENEDVIRDPASTTKTMVVYLTFEAIAAGKINMDTQVVATENDQAIAGIYALSNNKIVAGETYTVRELLTMTLVPSSNVTTLMLAHLIHDGDDASFLDLMNQTAKDLGMTNTHFNNASGAVVVAFNGYYAPVGYDHNLPNDTTAKDLAILAYHLLKKHPDVLEFTKDPKVTVKAGTPLEETFEAYNYSLPGLDYGYEGVDGLKTGSSPSAAFNAIVTAKRNDTRLITVVMGVGDWSDQNGEYYRHYFINTLLDKTFADYKRQILAPAGQQEIDGKKIILKENLYGLAKVGELPQLTLNGQMVQVAGSVDAAAGVAFTEAAVNKEEASAVTGTKDKSTKENKLLSLPVIAGLSMAGVLVLFLATILYFRNKAQKRRRLARSQSQGYSRRHRR